MDHIWVRKAEARDMKDLAAWLPSTPSNLWDPDIFQYPLTTTNVAFRRDQLITFMPMQLVTMLESLAHNPEASELDRAQAVKELVRSAITQSRDRGVSEVYFITNEPTIAELAKRHAQFEELPHRLLRLKIASLEKS